MNGDAVEKEKNFATNLKVFTVSAATEMVESVLIESENKMMKQWKMMQQIKVKKVLQQPIKKFQLFLPMPT